MRRTKYDAIKDVKDDVQEVFEELHEDVLGTVNVKSKVEAHEVIEDAMKVKNEDDACCQ